MSRTISVRDFAGLCANLPKHLEDAAVRGLRSAAAWGIGVVVEEIDNASPYPAVDTGAMRQSVAYEPIEKGASLFVQAPHASTMEYGMRPGHWVPLNVLILWATRKFLLGGGAKAARKRRARNREMIGPKEPPKQGPRLPPKQGPRKPPKHGPRMSKKLRQERKAAKAFAQASQEADNMAKAHAIARAVRWKIYHRGIAPRGFFTKAMARVIKAAPREVRRELKALEKRL